MEISVTIEHGAEVQARLAELSNAAAVLGGAQVQVGTDVVYAKFVVEGTRPHEIYPRDKQALYWAGAAHPVRGPVHHPGTKANPFLQNAMDSVTGQVEEFVSAQIDQVAAGRGSNYSQIMPGAAKIVLQAAQANAPVRTGNLRRSLYSV